MSDEKIIIYYTTVSSSHATKTQQQKIMTVLEGKRQSYEKKDVASSEDFKQEMRDKMEKATGIAKPLPPQIFKGDIYLGNYDSLYNAVEEDKFDDFLQGKFASSAGQQAS